MVTVRVVFSQLPKWLRSLSSSAKFYSWSRKSVTSVSLDQSETKQKAITTWLIPAFPRLALVAYFLVSMFSCSWRGFHLLTLVFHAWDRSQVFPRLARVARCYEIWLVHCNVYNFFDWILRFYNLSSIKQISFENQWLDRLYWNTKCQQPSFVFYLHVDDRAVQHRCSYHHKTSEESCKASSWSSTVKYHLKQLE